MKKYVIVFPRIQCELLGYPASIVVRARSEAEAQIEAEARAIILAGEKIAAARRASLSVEAR